MTEFQFYIQLNPGVEKPGWQIVEPFRVAINYSIITARYTSHSAN